jgi:hypothetical protein
MHLAILCTLKTYIRYMHAMQGTWKSGKCLLATAEEAIAQCPFIAYARGWVYQVRCITQVLT